LNRPHDSKIVEKNFSGRDARPVVKTDKPITF